MFGKVAELFHLSHFALYIYLHGYSEIENSTENIICADLKHVPVIGYIAVSTSNTNKNKAHVDYYLSTNHDKERVQINLFDWEGLTKSVFDPSSKTIVIIHGYQSSSSKKWVLDLKKKLLDTRDANIIMVDWSQASHHTNYVSAARKTLLISQQLFNFLQLMRQHTGGLKSTSNEIKWNHLYFIGHSLGAQISGQTAYLLKQDSFWKVERITGLDPAKPCFVNTKPHLRIDKENADFVDVIHTQVGYDDEVLSFGMKDSVGHIDFYVNGGVAQPQCLASAFNMKLKTVICSHKLSSQYFIESLNSKNKTCPFEAFKWDKSYQDARRILNDKMKGLSCSDCPEMGINAPNKNKTGSFLVITSTSTSHCQFDKKDYDKVIKVIEKIKH